MHLPVSLPQHECDIYHYVRLNIGQKGLTMITSKWGEIVQAYKIKQNDICVFVFHDCPDSGLLLRVFTILTSLFPYLLR